MIFTAHAAASAASIYPPLVAPVPRSLFAVSIPCDRPGRI